MSVLISKKFEICAYSYREERGDSPVTVKVDDIDISDALGVTIYNRTEKDAWMHCWFSLRLPKDQEALEKLKRDVAKMKKEFGTNFAFIPAQNLKPLVFKLQKLSEKPLFRGKVEYTEDKYKWGNLVKALDYSYQREYRFLFVECPTSEKEAYLFNNPDGFSDLILKNTDFKLQSDDGKQIWFDLTA